MEEIFDFFEEHEEKLLVCIVVLCLIIIGLEIFTDIYEKKNTNSFSQIEVLDEVITEESAVKDFFVEIKGAVKKPGVYKVSSNNIINDVISLAGGLTKDAFTNNINLSRRVKEEMVIYVYTKSEYKKINSKGSNKQTECVCKSEIIDKCTNNGYSEIITESDNNKDIIYSDSINDNNEESVSNTLVNINTSSIEMLTTLNGIGESKAKAIIEYREKNGPFKSIEDIKNVSGLGDSLYEKIKDYIRV